MEVVALSGLVRDRKRNAAPILCGCVETGLLLPSTRLGVCLVTKIADQRYGFGLYAFNSRAPVWQQGQHFGPLCQGIAAWSDNRCNLISPSVHRQIRDLVRPPRSIARVGPMSGV